jgi:UTP--glucose-1-phosphate uridylyltransferase
MGNSNVKTAVIPAAGLGTRFLPATKVLPKEILPVVDRPVIEYAVNEARDSGITHVVLVLSPGKDLLLRHFEPAPELESFLTERGKQQQLEQVRAIGGGITVEAVIQTEPLGLGHAVLMAREGVGDHYFTGLLPDDIFTGERPVLAQMLEVHERHRCTVLAVRRVPRQTISRYGAIKYSRNEGPVYFVEDVVEKPSVDEAPSELAIMGRYVLSPRIFAALDRTGRGAGGEVQLTDGVRNLLADEPVVALEFEADYFDVGTIPGFLKTSIAFGRARPEFREEIEAYLEQLLESPPDRPTPTH